MMKYQILFSLILTIVPVDVFCQLQLDLGNDSSYCWGSGDPMEMGSGMIISGGKPPYSFSWSTKYVIGNYVFYAGTFLDDTTAQYPLIHEFGSDLEWMKFNLTVRDEEGNIASDSIRVRGSIYGYYDFYFNYNVHLGDSIWLHKESNVIGGLLPIEYYWSPVTYLATPDNPEGSWCKPESTISYGIYGIDSIGCRSGSSTVYEITLLPPSKLNMNSYESEKIRQNGTQVLFPNTKQLPAQINIYSQSGALLRSITTHDSHINTLPLLLPKGIYILIVSVEDQMTSTKFYVN